MNSSVHSKKLALFGALAGACALVASVSLVFAQADTTPPTMPTGLSASAVSSTEINLSWTASTDAVGVTGYGVFRNGTQIATTSTTSYADTGLSPGTTYSYTTDAFDAAGNLSGQTASVSTATLVDTALPSVPTGLAATAVSASQINLSWNASTDNVGVTGYDIYRGGVLIATTGATSYSDTGLAASTGYSYTVAADDAAGNNSGQSGSVGATTLASGTTTVSPPAYTVPPTIQIDSNGNILIHGMTVTSVGTNTFTGTVWGLTYTVDYNASTTGSGGGRFQFLLRGGGSATFNAAQIQVGDQVGVQGTVTQSAPSVIQAQIVRNYSITTPRAENRQNYFSGSENGNGNGANITDLQNLLQQLLGRFRDLQAQYRR